MVKGYTAAEWSRDILQQNGQVHQTIRRMEMWLAHVEKLRIKHEFELQIITFIGAHGGALRYKPGRLGVRFLMVSLDFFIDIISPGGKGGR
jgi:hypothetical protein